MRAPGERCENQVYMRGTGEEHRENTRKQIKEEKHRCLQSCVKLWDRFVKVPSGWLSAMSSAWTFLLILQYSQFSYDAATKQNKIKFDTTIITLFI